MTLGSIATYRQLIVECFSCSDRILTLSFIDLKFSDRSENVVGAPDGNGKTDKL